MIIVCKAKNRQITKRTEGEPMHEDQELFIKFDHILDELTQAGYVVIAAMGDYDK